jgi:hypothetical protein
MLNPKLVARRLRAPPESGRLLMLPLQLVTLAAIALGSSSNLPVEGPHSTASNQMESIRMSSGRGSLPS